jgi:hypothetical protein
VRRAPRPPASTRPGLWGAHPGHGQGRAWPRTAEQER